MHQYASSQTTQIQFNNFVFRRTRLQHHSADASTSTSLSNQIKANKIRIVIIKYGYTLQKMNNEYLDDNK